MACLDQSELEQRKMGMRQMHIPISNEDGPQAEVILIEGSRGR